MKNNRLQLSFGQYACFAICLLLMIVIPITHNHKLIGKDVGKKTDSNTTAVSESNVEGDSITIINTTELCKDIGFKDVTPVEISIRNGKIEKIVALPNQETPSYQQQVEDAGLLHALDGLSVEEAKNTPIDAVSGATYTSNALIANIRAGLSTASGEVPDEVNQTSVKADGKFILTLIVIICGAFLPFFFKNKKYRYVQLALNVGIIGFWGGTFISYNMMVSSLSFGITGILIVPLGLLLVTAFIYPMFGRTDHYCTWLCPYGSLQELAGKCFPKKVHLSPVIVRMLTTFRQVLWFVLMWLLWTGLWFDWMDYEVFAAFMINSASPVVLGIAIAFVFLSLFVNRPYCRFVCPTGTLFKLSEGRK